MKIVIQCAASKQTGAGCMMTADGRNVIFVADPALAPPRNGYFYAKPDDASDNGTSWRDRLSIYNRDSDSNPLGLYPAYNLYLPDEYRQLVGKYGVENVYILSAGWGMIRADFLTPHYDITFSPSAKAENVYKRRRKVDRYSDFNQLAAESTDDLVLFSGKDYLPFFQKLTLSYVGTRYVFYNSAAVPQLSGCKLVRYDTTTRTNWHYECVRAFLAGKVRW